MSKVIKVLITCGLIVVLLNSSFILVKSLGKKDLSLDYSQDSKIFNSRVVEETVN